jgi:uncharacterized membrane protein YdjX (TVP38/TMEM64 family)
VSIPPANGRQSLRQTVVAIWLVLVASALSLYFFRRDLVVAGFEAVLAAAATPGGAIVYVIVGTLRVFTLVPATVLIVSAIPFFEPWTLLVLTITVIATSSSICYWFAEALRLDEGFRRRYPDQIRRLTETLQRYELPIIIGWSFLLFLPTDLICYVCGSLRINFPKFLLGVVIGEGTVYAIYIFAADWAIGLLTL